MILRTIIMSFIIIFLFHHLYIFFKKNLTVPTVRDFVETNEHSLDIHNIINDSVKENKTVDLEKETSSMKSELKMYIKNLTNDNTTNVNPEQAFNQPYLNK